MNLKPLGTRVHLKVISKSLTEDTMYGSIIIPRHAAEMYGRHMQAEVLAVGDKVFDKRLVPGVRILTERWRKSPIGDDDETIVFEQDLIAIVEGGENE